MSAGHQSAGPDPPSDGLRRSPGPACRFAHIEHLYTIDREHIVILLLLHHHVTSALALAEESDGSTRRGRSPLVGAAARRLQPVQQQWVRRLTDGEIRGVVGAERYELGAAHVTRGRVSKVSVLSDGHALSATVGGDSRTPYHILVPLPRGTAVARGSTTGYCTCARARNCEHVAAVMLAARDTLGTSGTSAGPLAAWERSVAQLVQTPQPRLADAGIPLALQLDVVNVNRPPARPGTAALTPASGRRVRIRPVVPGRNGSWIRTGITWRDLQHDYGYPKRVQEHRDALRELHRAHPATSNGYYTYSDTPVYLDEFGPALWRLLEQVVDAGVVLVPTKASTGAIMLAETPAQAVLDLRRSTLSADATLEPVITVAGSVMEAASVSLLGAPAHGVVVDASEVSLPADVVPAPSLLLAPLHERTSEQVSALLKSGQPLRIPAPDLDRFLREYYPGLRQVIRVRSSDETVALPEIAPPKLALKATHAPGHRVTLQWSFAYQVADDVHRLPVRGPTGAKVARDARAERGLLRDLRLPDDRLPQLRENTPERLVVPEAELQGMDAVFFTEDLLPALRDSGDIDVEVVGTPPDYRHSEAAPLVKVSATDSAGDLDWFDLGITVSIDGEEIPFQRLFLALAHGETHLVLDSGTYFSIERPELDQLRRLIDEARALQDHESGGLRISRFQAGLWEELLELGVVEVQSERWASSVKGLMDIGGVEPTPTPNGLDAELRPYQLEGYQWLSFLWDHGLGGILADDMGLGKTVQTLATICRAREAGELAHPVLVVAPTSVVANWAQEAARFAPELAVVTIGETETRRETSLVEQTAGADLVVASYALFRIDYDVYDGLEWSGLVLDEAQFVKNHQAKTYQCARRLKVPFKLAITGTPLENSLMDLWSLLSIVAPGLFPSPQRFSEFFRKPIERGADPALLATLRRRVRPLMLRRTKEQVAAELPPKQEQVLEVVLNPRHQKIYQTHLQRERQKVLGLIDDLDKNRFAIFRSITLLRQLSLDPALVDDSYAGVRSSKVDVFFEQLQEVVSEGHRALVFSQFTGFLRTVRDRLDAEQVRYVYLDGRTRNRGKRVEEFKSGDAPVFLISLKAGGFGLNLTEADYCFVLDPWWNPAVEAQAVDRTHRIGQDKTVMVYRMVAADTIEEKVMALKARKEDLFARVMDDEGLLSTPLTADDIKGLLAG
jgi:superfamily II DNA or RNA helicase